MPNVRHSINSLLVGMNLLLPLRVWFPIPLSFLSLINWFVHLTSEKFDLYPILTGLMVRVVLFSLYFTGAAKWAW